MTENDALVAKELPTRAPALDPTGAILHSGKPGDGGIDGIISHDPRGLDRIYVQAKRYAPGHSTQRRNVQ